MAFGRSRSREPCANRNCRHQKHGSGECRLRLGISTKVRLGKLEGAAGLAADFASHIERAGFQPLPISIEHASRAGLLAGVHKDPFDRMLIAQAQAENLALVSNEIVFDAYGVRRIW